MKFSILGFSAAVWLMLFCTDQTRAATTLTSMYNGDVLHGPVVTDTVPGNKPVPDNADGQKKEELIKEVPKAKKQEKPVAVVPVTIKPVVVKPKVIIKPIIKIH